MKQLIYVACYANTDDHEPILASFTEEDLVRQLNKWNGLSKNQSKIIKDERIIYEGKLRGNLLRKMKYESPPISDTDEDLIDTYEIWLLEI